MSFLKITSLLMFAILSLSVSAEDLSKQGGLFVENSYIVKFKSNQSGGKASERSPVHPAVSRERLRVMAPIPFGENSSGQSKESLAAQLGIRGKVVSIFDALNSAHMILDSEEVERLRKDPRVLRVERDRVATVSQSVQMAPGQSTELKPPVCMTGQDEAWSERGFWAGIGRECVESSSARA